MRESHSISEAHRLAQGGHEGVVVTASIDAYLPETDGVVWVMDLEEGVVEAGRFSGR